MLGFSFPPSSISLPPFKFPTFHSDEMVYNVIFIIINFVLMFVEVSVLILMSENYTISGREALPKAVWISVLIAFLYACTQVCLVLATFKVSHIMTLTVY